MDEVKASSVMTREVISVAPDTPVREVARLMAEKRLRAVPVLDGQGRLLGVVSEEDLVHQDARVHFPTFFHLLEGYIMLPGSLKRFEKELRQAVGATAGEVMDTEFRKVGPDTGLSEVATCMAEKDCEYLLVMQGDKLEGMITRADIIRFLAGQGNG
jgi:CBS domain-containing protein